MKVYLVWTEQGEYEQYSRDLRGIFATELLAAAHIEQLGVGEIVEQDLLTEIPHRVKLYRWADHVAADGKLSPDWEGPFPLAHLGRTRESWETWSNELPEMGGNIKEWNRRDHSLFVDVIGMDKDAVRQEHARLVSKARERLKAVKLNG